MGFYTTTLSFKAYYRFIDTLSRLINAIGFASLLKYIMKKRKSNVILCFK